MTAPKEKKITIIHTCQWSIIKTAIKSILEKDGAFEVIGDASGGNELWALLEQTRPDIILLELFIPNENGLQTLEDLKKQYPGIGVVVLSYVDHPGIIQKALDAGAGAYITYSDEPAEVIAAIHSCLDSEIYISTLAKRKWNTKIK